MEVTLRFNDIFNAVGKGGEEVVSGHAFHFVDGHGGGLHSTYHLVVRHYESYPTGGVGSWRQYNFEEAFWNGHTRIADIFPDGVVEYGATHDDYRTVGLRPCAAFFFESFPGSGVERFHLRADIGQ